MEKVIVNVPSDERGKYVKKVAERAGITEFNSDEFGNIQFEASEIQLEGILNWSCIGTYKMELSNEVSCTGLCLGDIAYGQVWYSKEEYDDYKKKTADAW